MLRTPPLGLYVHIPWCVRKCPYCDFNSHGNAGDIPEARYTDALLRDLDKELERVPGRLIETIFFGGGTPSLFRPKSIDRLLSALRQRGVLSSDAEITLEANPGTAEAAKFRGFREAGVNRLSIGVQSFDNRLLQVLGRIHDGEDARRAVTTAREAGFDNLNVDLMFGLPGQTEADARSDLETAFALSPEQISWYQLTLEPGTAFYQRPPLLPDQDIIWRMQRDGQAVLAAEGYQHYEVSAHARAGKWCRHNVNYWTFGDYLGIGAGSHGKVTDAGRDRLFRTAKIRRPETYLSLQPDEASFCSQADIAPDERPLEFLMNHLRLREGFPEGVFAERTGLALDSLEPMLSRCVDEGLLERRQDRICCSEQGWQFLDSVLSRFVH